MSVALERVKEENDRLRSRMRGAAQRAREASGEIMDTAVTAVSGFAYGKWEHSRRQANQAMTIAGIDADLAVGLGGIIAAEFLDGDSARLVRAAARGVSAIAGYKRGLQG